MNPLLRLGLISALLLTVPLTAGANSGFGGRIGPSGAEVAGAIAGVAVAATVILYFVLRKPGITGCVTGTGDSATLTNKQDKQVYQLAGNQAGLKAGERLKLKGKSFKEKNGERTFRVKNVDHDYGACTP